MDIKLAESFMKKLIDKSKDYGFEEAEASFSSGSSMSISILNGEVQSYERSNEQGVAFKGKKNGQMAAASTTEFTDDALLFLLTNAADCCDVKDDEDEDFIYCDPEHKELKLSQITDAFEKNTYARFSELGLKLEKSIFALSEDIKGIDHLSISCDRSLDLKINSKGLYAYKDSDYVGLMAVGRAERDGVVKTGGHYWYGNDIDKFDEEKFLKIFSQKLLTKFGASSVPSAKYKILLSNEAVISFISTFMSNFSSYSMQKGMSLLAGKEGEKIASDIFTLREEPMYEKALIKVPFDSEGVLTYPKSLIENGVFKTALYNLKTANKAGIKSTGNGFKGIGYANLIVEPGEKTFDELLEEVGDGLYITDLSGLHAGVNVISGDFSLLCEGYRIEGGKITHAVEQITVSDNFYDVLKKISHVGNDVLAEPDGAGELFAPSIVINSVSIAGDK